MPWLRFSRDADGAAAIEFAMVSLPFLMFCLGILQFVMLQYTQVILSDALYSSASMPETQLIAEDLAGYKTIVCAKIPVVSNCPNAILVEMMRIGDLPTATTPITGQTFDSGSSGDVLVLRASIPTLQIVPFIPSLLTRDSVIFRRS